MAGAFAATLFTVGIVGVGLVSIPTLITSAAYALAETFCWKNGLNEKFKAGLPTEADATWPEAIQNILNGVLTAVYPFCDVLLVLLVLRILIARPRQPAAHLLTGASLCLVSADVTYFSPVVANGELAGRVIGILGTRAYPFSERAPSVER